MGDLIFSTVAGSHLYGLAHEASDMDVYEVYGGKSLKLHQRTDGHDDSVRGTLDAFLKRAYSGSHQSVEALFSKKKVWGLDMQEKYGSLVDNLFIEGGEVFAKYERTIRKFCYGDFKRRRHACRLRLNLQDLRDYGRFDPTMTETQIVMANAYAKTFADDELVRHLL